MLAATTSPWYLPTWVSGQMPLTSPIAQSPSPPRSWASTGTPWASGSMPTVSSPMPSHPRPPACRDEQAVAAQLAAVVELEDVLVAVAARCARVRAEDELDVVAAKNLAERLAQRRRLAREDVLGHVDDHRLAPEAANGLGHLDPDRPAAEDQQAARDRGHRGHLAVASRRRRAPAGPDTGGVNGSAPLARTMWSAVCWTPSTSTAPGPARRAAAADQIDLVVGQPCSCPASVWSETMKSRQASAASTSTSALRGGIARGV